MECPLCKNNADKWTDAGAFEDIVIRDGKAKAITRTEKICANCGFVAVIERKTDG